MVSKRLEGMRRNPLGNWTRTDIEAVCREFDVTCEPPRGGGSHFKVYDQRMADILPSLSNDRSSQYISGSLWCSSMRLVRQMTNLKYQVLITPLPEAEGGGFLATVPDLPGCMSDGSTPEDAVRDVQDAIGEWLNAAEKLGRAIPRPTQRRETA